MVSEHILDEGVCPDEPCDQVTDIPEASISSARRPLLTASFFCSAAFESAFHARWQICTVLSTGRAPAAAVADKSVTTVAQRARTPFRANHRAKISHLPIRARVLSSRM